MELNLIKVWRENRRKRMEKMYAQAEQEIRDEAVEKITIREVVFKDNHEKKRAICFDGSVIYLAEGNEDLTEKLLNLRKMYFLMWCHNPMIELR